MRHSTKKNRTLKRAGLGLTTVLSFSLLLPPNGHSIELNANGSHGRDGQDGNSNSSYSNAAAYGDGRNGGNAGPSSAGMNGGNISVTLSDLERGGNGYVQILGTVDGRGANQTVDLSPGLNIHLKALGGNGGRGGNGGDGEGGARGQRGSDATRYSSGTNGGRGHNGGNGGDATAGSNGGDGGTINVQLPINDLHLALLVQTDVAGGQGGTGGKPGRGGQGGDGGSGGSSFSWEEKTGERCDPDRLESNSNGSYTTVKGQCHDIMTSHSNSGGFQGSSGSSGHSGGGNISSGARGRDGTYSFSVKEENGSISRYSRPFDLRMTSFSFRELDPNGIFEPGETVEVTGIQIENRSDMPWVPGKAKAIVSLSNTDWIIAEPQEIEIPAVNGKSRIQLSKTLTFKIRDNRLKAEHNRMSISESIVPMATMTRINRTVDGLRLPRTLVISYPVEVSRISAKKTSLAPGESTDIFWSVKNISTAPLGTQSAAGRSLEASIRSWRPTGSENLAGGVTFNGSQIISAYSQSVALLQPGASFTLKGTLTFDDKNLPYTDFYVGAGAKLKTIESGSPSKEVQLSTLRFTIAQIFAGAADSNWLLVTNGGTQRDEYVAWLSLAKRLGMKVDVWDVSYQGTLALLKALPKGAALSDLYKNRTIIVLNNANDKHVRSSDMISTSEYLQAARDKGVRVYIVGGDEKLDLLTKKHSTGSGALISYEDAMTGRVPFEQNETYNVEITDKSLFKPKTTLLQTRIDELKTQLTKAHPKDRFLIKVVNRTIKKIGDGLRPQYTLGTIDVTRTLGTGVRGGLAWLPRDDRETQDKNFILSDENMAASLVASGLREKYVAMKSVAANPAWQDLALNSMVLEIAEAVDNESPNTAIIEELKALIQNDATNPNATASLGLLGGRLEFYMKKASLTKMDSALEPLVTLLTTRNSKSANAEYDRLNTLASDRKGMLPGIDKRQNARRMLFMPIISRTLRTSHLVTQGLL
ncbi:MAG: hypothetical protein JNJ49_09510 [Bdellovibrionaceae bacterium]|nr:hypothetical protein [Pseudobdellovibrionaceae bacterium]